MDFIIRNAAATERDLLASTREPTRHRRAFSAFRPNLSRSTYSNLLSDCTKSLDKKKYSFIVQLQQNINLLPFSSWYLFIFFHYRLYVTMQQGKKPLVQKRSNMSSSPSYAIQQKIIFGKKYIVVIHVMFQSLVSRQLQTTKNVIGSLDIIQFLSNIQSLLYLYHNYQKIDILILLFTLDRGTSNRKGLKSSLYFISIILVPLHFSVMKINILLYLYTPKLRYNERSCQASFIHYFAKFTISRLCQ